MEGFISDYQKEYNAKLCTIEQCLELIHTGATAMDEYGIARLKDATVSERIVQMIAIAHPDDRAKEIWPNLV